jgi:hypothetical protein
LAEICAQCEKYIGTQGGKSTPVELVRLRLALFDRVKAEWIKRHRVSRNTARFVSRLTLTDFSCLSSCSGDAHRLQSVDSEQCHVADRLRIRRHTLVDRSEQGSDRSFQSSRVRMSSGESSRPFRACSHDVNKSFAKILAHSKHLDWRSIRKPYDVQVALGMSIADFETFALDTLHETAYTLNEVAEQLHVTLDELIRLSLKATVNRGEHTPPIDFPSA